MGGLAVGIDLGTTAVKAMVLDEAGEAIAAGSAASHLVTGPDGLVEQRVEDLWEGTRAAVRDALGGSRLGASVRALALSSQGGTLILLDGGGSPIGNAISWMDSRPARLGPRLLAGRDDAWFYQKTGWCPSVGCLPLAQLLRLRMVAAPALEPLRGVRFVDSFVMERLTGDRVTGPSDAAITALYNVCDRRWDAELLALAGLSEEMLPAVRPSGTAVGILRREAAEELGISQRAVGVIGGHDQYCAAFGAECTQAGDTMVSCGTAWVVLTMAAGPRFDPRAKLAPAEAVSGGLWGLLGSSPAAGASVDWLRRAVEPGGEAAPFEEWEAAAAAVEPSAGGPVFRPPAAGAAGELTGLRLHHGFGHVARAVLEGAALSARSLLERMRVAGTMPSRLRAVGGAARSRLWMQILSDATGLPLEVAGVQEAASFGAAMLAGRTAGVIRAEVGWPRPAAQFEPRPRFTAVYDELSRQARRDHGEDERGAPLP